MELSDIKGRYKQIDGFPDYYITEYGEVYSKRLRGHENVKKLRKMRPKNPGKDNKYYNVILCSDNGKRTRDIHRLVAEYFVDGYFDGAVVNHIDGNNKNNVATNLEWTTVKDNVNKSYKTSGIPATRNFRLWTLFDPGGNMLGTFVGHSQLEKYIIDNKINASPSSLCRYMNSKGYTVKKSEERIGNCNDYSKEVAKGETPSGEASAPVYG